MKSNIYITPTIKSYFTFDELKSESSPTNMFASYLFDKENLWDESHVFKNKFNLVISEPGHGKTEFLKHISETVSNNFKKKSIFLELKSVNNDIEFYLKNEKEFKFSNSKKYCICFDALDEVKFDRFNHLCEEIFKFQKKYKNIYFFVSCRFYFINNHTNFFKISNIRYLKIFPFSLDKVKEYLSKHQIPDNVIGEIEKIISHPFKDLLIQIPRYLYLLKEYYKGKQGGVINWDNISRSELMEYFIYHKLNIEDEKFDVLKKEIIKNLLEKLALIMEIYQTNVITHEELMIFFDDLKSDMKISFLSQVPFEYFLNRSIKNNGDSYEFDNTEFQEYLASKELRRIRKTDQTIFDIIVEPEINEILPSWLNTLKFYIDSDPTFVQKILKLKKKSINSKILHENYLKLLTDVNANKLDSLRKSQIFKYVFNYYQENLIWLKWEVSRNISFYFQRDNEKLLIKFYKVAQKSLLDNETKFTVLLGNIAEIIGLIIERNVLNPVQQLNWKKRFLETIKIDSIKPTLHRLLLFSLSQFKDTAIIKKVQTAFKSKDQLVREAYIDLCSFVNPHSKISIQYFIEGTIQRNLKARYGLYKLKSKQSIILLIDELIDNKNFLEAFLNQESIFEDNDKELINNIKRLFKKNNPLIKKLEELVLKTYDSHDLYHDRSKSKFIKEITYLIKKNNKKFIFQLIKILNNNKNDVVFYYYEPLFELLLEASIVKKFIKSLSSLKLKRNIALNVLLNFKYSNRDDAMQIYETGRLYFNKEYDDAEKKNKSPLFNYHQVYEQLLYKLEPSKGKYITDVFQFYINNEKNLKNKIKYKDLKRMKEIIEKYLLYNFNSSCLKLSYKRELGRKTNTYSVHSLVPIITTCIKVVGLLNIDINKKYFSKLILFIPFTYQETRECIFNIIENYTLTKKDTTAIINIYNDTSNDLSIHNPESFIEFAQKYNITQAIPILKRFVGNKDFLIQYRRKSFEVCHKLNKDKDFLIEYFEKYKNSSDDSDQITVLSNELLITDYNDTKHIKWRMDETIKKSFKIDDANTSQGTRFISPSESELRDKSFVKPLMILDNPKFEKLFLSFLRQSFALIKDDKLYFKYADYLWSVIIEYYKNLKTQRSYKYLRNLENEIHLHGSIEGVNWFQYGIHTLKDEYIRYIGKPLTINECIQKYNIIKDKLYKHISDSNELFFLIKKHLTSDLKTWVEDEGAYKIILDKSIFYNDKNKKPKKEYEKLIQKTIKTQIENSLLKNNIDRYSICREKEYLNDKKPDFVINYGFFDPIVIELKLTSNGDLQISPDNMHTSESYRNINLYMNSENTNKGLFVIFNNAKMTTKKMNKIKNVYEKIPDLEVIVFNVI